MYSLKVYFKDGAVKESFFDVLEGVFVEMGVLEVYTRRVDDYMASHTSYQFDLSLVLSWSISNDAE